MMKYDFVVIIHRLYANGFAKKGGVDIVIDYLLSKGKKILLLEFPLEYSQSREIRTSEVTQNTVMILDSRQVPLGISVICWMLEFIYTFWCISHFSGGGGVIITSDPLTTLPAVLLKRFGVFKFHYYHSVDYSTDRFNNKFLNFIYLLLLKLGLRNADLVGIVTKQAAQRLTGFGVKNTIYLPNSLDYHALDSVRKPVNDREPFSMVITCSDVSNKYLIRELVDLTKKLSVIFPEITLRVIGRFDANETYCMDLAKYIQDNKLQDLVVFHGQISRELNYELISKSYIGLAFYDGLHSHVIYGDALKIREYAALGIPCVADTHTYTAVEMNDCGGGFTVANLDEAFEKIVLLMTNSQVYDGCTEAALRWSEQNDKRKLLDSMYDAHFKPLELN